MLMKVLIKSKMVARNVFVVGKRGAISRKMLSDNLILSRKSFQSRVLNYFDATYENELITNSHVTISEEMFNKLKETDNQLRSQLPALTKSDILKALMVFMKYTPGRLHEYDSFYPLLVQLNKYRQINQFVWPKDHLQMLFYLPFLKKNEKFASEAVKDLLRDIDKYENYSFMQLSIIMYSCFRNKIRLSRRLLRYAVEMFLNHFDVILNDQTFLVTFLKTFRLNKVNDVVLLESLKSTLYFNQVLPKYSLTTLAHILIFYSDCRHFDKHFLEYISQLACTWIERIPHEYKPYYHYENSVRAKDIATVLWAVSSLGFEPKSLTNETFCRHILMKQVMCRMEAGEYKKHIEDLIDTILALWMLNADAHIDENIYKYLFSDSVQTALNSTAKVRFSSRLQLLFQCVRVVNGFDWLPDKLHLDTAMSVPIDGQVQKRSMLRKLKEKLSTRFQVDYSFPVPHLHFLSLVVTSSDVQKKLYIELMDDYVLLANKNTPNGFMKLKLRLLKSLNYHVIALTKQESRDSGLLEKLTAAIEQHLNG